MAYIPSINVSMRWMDTRRLVHFRNGLLELFPVRRRKTCHSDVLKGVCREGYGLS
jgi:hypothetical protein